MENFDLRKGSLKNKTILPYLEVWRNVFGWFVFIIKIVVESLPLELSVAILNRRKLGLEEPLRFEENCDYLQRIEMLHC